MFTVAIIFSHSTESAKQVSSKNELCSEYGTAYTWRFTSEPFICFRSSHVNCLRCALVNIDEISVTRPAPPGGENLVTTMLGGAIVREGKRHIRPPSRSEPYDLGESIFPVIRIAFEPFSRNQAQRHDVNTRFAWVFSQHCNQLWIGLAS